MTRPTPRSTGMTPAVTWLLPVRNGMPFLREALASIAEQDYPAQRVIAWDNGSTDGSQAELRRWIGVTLPGEVVTDRPTTLGLSLAAMVERADSELCARLDADDLALPGRVRAQVAFMQANPQVAVLGTALRLIDAEGRVVGDASSPLVEDHDIRWHLRFGNAVAHPSVMFRRSVVLGAGNYRDLMPGQDYDLWCRVAARHGFANLPTPLTAYRMHEGTVTAQHLDRYRAIGERLRARHLETLWPGETAASAARLLRLIEDPADLNVTYADLVTLRRVATLAAQQAGRPANYFRATARYRRQFRNLLTRWLKAQPVTRPVWPAVRWLARAARLVETPCLPRVEYRAEPKRPLEVTSP